MPTWLIVSLAVVVVLGLLALQDVLQTGHAIRRVYPLLGRLRYLVEMIGPELRQYIVTSDLDEWPFSRSQRAWVYQAAKQVDTSIGFGTQVDTWRPGSFHFLPSPFATLHEEAPDAGEPVLIGALSAAAVRSPLLRCEHSRPAPRERTATSTPVKVDSHRITSRVAVTSCSRSAWRSTACVRRTARWTGTRSRASACWTRCVQSR